MLADLAFAAGLLVAAGWMALWAVELSRAREVRFLPRWAWALLCVFWVPAGAIAYLIAGRVWGRPRGRRPGREPPQSRLPRDNGRSHRRWPRPRACEHSVMGQELTRMLCPECGTAGEADPDQSRWQCTQCGGGFFLRRCSACTRVSYVDGLQGFRLPWACAWCGRFNTGFSQNQDPAAASAAEFAAELARYGPPGGEAEPEAGDQAKTVPITDAGPPRAREPGEREPAWAANAAYPGTAQPRPGQAAKRPLPGGRRARRVGLTVAAAVVVACAAAAGVVLTAGDPGAAGIAAPVAVTRPVLFTASGVGSIDFRGVPGQLVLAGTRPGQVIMTGQLRGEGSAPVVETRFDHATGVLTVSVRCAPATRCTQNLRLAVPGVTGAAVWQPSGRVVATGLAGPLRITAANADISAGGLRSADLSAVVTNGHLSAAFAVPPHRVSITLASAQATVRLPAHTGYRVIREVTSGSIRVAIPLTGDATRIVTARIDSGELKLLPT